MININDVLISIDEEKVYRILWIEKNDNMAYVFNITDINILK